MDIDVVVRAQGGDQAAFAQLATEGGRRMNALAVGILRDRELAEDAVQQALLSIWKDLPQLRDPARYESWSYKLLVRACYAESRKRKRRLVEVFGVTAREPVAVDDIGSVADRDQLERGFRRLSLEHRAVVVMHHYLDMPLESVAAALGIPAGTARSRFHRAMASLRAALEADNRPPTPPASATNPTPAPGATE
jgi:RNA polymerase sigma-70 factor (ECF subfamily)